MAIKMIVMDMDGTLYRNDKSIDPSTIEMLKDCQRKGITIVLASGRNCYDLQKTADKLDMRETGYLIGLNGLEVMCLKDGSHEVEGQMTSADAAHVFRLVDKYDLKGIAFTFEKFYFYVRPYHRWWKQILSFFERKIKEIGFEGEMENNCYLKHANDEIKVPINKLILQSDKISELKPLLAKDLTAYDIMIVGPKWLEIMKKGISKGSGVLRVAKRLGISSDEIMCFGDAENDLSMIECVKYGIAMGNAMDNVKEAAYYVTDTNMNQGIAKAIEHFRGELYEG